MKIEFIPDGSDDCPLVRLSNFDHMEARSFVESVDLLVRRRLSEVRLDQATYVEAVGGCRLCLTVGGKDRGVVQTSTGTFEWTLTRDGWIDVCCLAKPFFYGKLVGRFQWLSEHSDISVLFSPDGNW